MYVQKAELSLCLHVQEEVKVTKCYKIHKNINILKHNRR